MTTNHLITDNLEWTKSNVEGFTSKSLLNLSNGSLKLSKVEPNCKYPIHKRSEKTEFIYILGGSPTISIGSNVYTGYTNEFFTLPFNIDHSIENLTNKECILLVGAIPK